MEFSSDLSSNANSVSTSSSNFICRKLESSFNEVDFSTYSSYCTTTTDSCCTTDDAGEGGYSPGNECQSLSQQDGFVQVKPPSPNPSPSPSPSPSRRGSLEGEEGWLIAAAAAATIGRNAVAAAPFKLPSENHGCFLWFTSIRDISDEYLQELQGTLALSHKERSKVAGFYFADDRKRALTSILLQRSLIRTHFGVKDHEYVIERTKEDKPYAKSPVKSFDKWNYNVSHQGDLVAIVSHGFKPIGIDLVEINSRNFNVAKNIQEYVGMFEMQFAKPEIEYILKSSEQTFSESMALVAISNPSEISEEDFKYQKFYITWALKEAFSKALGEGLGFDLRQAIFSIDFEKYQVAGTWPKNGVSLCICSGSATLTLHGQVRRDWSLHFRSVDPRHIMAIAQGPELSVTSKASFAASMTSGAAALDEGPTTVFSTRLLDEYPEIVWKSVDSLKT